MKIVSWNVNSVRARIENILDYIKDTNPDILLLQEILLNDLNDVLQVVLNRNQKIPKQT